MSTLEPTDAQMQAFREAPLEGPVVMVNLLRFRPDGGAASYARYGALVGPLLRQVGGRVVYQGSGRCPLIGAESWDQVLLVEYPSREAFLQMIASDAYREAVRHRHEALVDSRLYCTQPG